MGAGSIGGVPASVLQRAKQSDLLVELKKIKDKTKAKKKTKINIKDDDKSKKKTKKIQLLNSN